MSYFTNLIDVHHNFEQLRTVGTVLRPLIHSLSNDCHHHYIVAALLVVKWHFDTLEPDDRGINETRAYACEIVAWRFLTHLSEIELIDYLLSELPNPRSRFRAASSVEDHSGLVIERAGRQSNGDGLDERSRLLSSSKQAVSRSIHEQTSTQNTARSDPDEDDEDDPTVPFLGLNALEIAAVADAKKFLSQNVVQRIVNALWCGDIVFWDSLTTHARKKAHRYNKRCVISFNLPCQRESIGLHALHPCSL